MKVSFFIRDLAVGGSQRQLGVLAAALARRGHDVAVIVLYADGALEALLGTSGVRVLSIGKAYQSQSLRDQGDGAFVGKVDPPASGWTAFFVELTYDVGQSFPLKLTTAVRILPDKLPYADLDPAKAQLEARPARK